ncbi:hypothetical protein ACFV2X_46880 [Streptomyces sp. NPDC059679]|uniref:hypothetical protein n=1 Tax=Streptomyces sp. NPDC059679 TaxID=3346903 RepID=UPI00368EB08D
MGPIAVVLDHTTATALRDPKDPYNEAVAHAARPSADFPTGRFLLTLTPETYEDTGVQAVHPDE